MARSQTTERAQEQEQRRPTREDGAGDRKQATRPVHRRIALVFDFDATLAPSSIDALLRRLGHDPERFRAEHVRPLVEEHRFVVVLAGFYAFVQESRRRDEPITRALLEEVGRELEFFPGVPELFDQVRGWARAIVPGVEVEFYVVTAGHEEIHKATRIAGEFEAMWGSEFHFDADGAIAFPRRILTFREKVQYLLALSKGLDVAGPNSPAGAYRPVPDDELHVPLDQVVYVGDGSSDLPVFGLMHDRGGIGIAVNDAERAEDWDELAKMRPGRRVANLASPDYREGAELLESIRLATQSICHRIALRELGRGE